MLAFCFPWSGNVLGAQIAGWVEQARLQPAGIELKAKLDTGAEHSSVNALSIVTRRRDGREYAHFTVRNKPGESVDLVLPVVRHATIKRHFGKAQTRPVVRLSICIGNVTKQAEVNLVDRAGFNYPLLVGRSYLEGVFLIDSGAKFTLNLRCEQGVTQ